AGERARLAQHQGGFETAERREHARAHARGGDGIDRFAAAREVLAEGDFAVGDDARHADAVGLDHLGGRRNGDPDAGRGDTEETRGWAGGPKAQGRRSDATIRLRSSPYRIARALSAGIL